MCVLSTLPTVWVSRKKQSLIHYAAPNRRIAPAVTRLYGRASQDAAQPMRLCSSLCSLPPPPPSSSQPVLYSAKHPRCPAPFSKLLPNIDSGHSTDVTVWMSLTSCGVIVAIKRVRPHIQNQRISSEQAKLEESHTSVIMFHSDFSLHSLNPCIYDIERVWEALHSSSGMTMN